MRLTRAGVALVIFLLIACPLASVVSYLALTGQSIGPLRLGAPTAVGGGGRPQPTALATATSPGTSAAARTPTPTRVLGVVPETPASPVTGGATAATSPAATVAAPVGTVGTVGATQPAGGTAAAGGPAVTVAYDAYAPYYAVRIAQQLELAQQYGITLRPVPFGLGGENEFNEAERRQALKDGRFDVLLTTLDAVALFPDEATGKVVAIVDESAGADKIVARQPVARLNDLRGKRITYSAGSVSEYFLYANLSLVGLGPGDVTLVPQDDIEKAVEAFKANRADALVGWEPNIGEVLEDPNVKVVIGTDNFRAILDVIVVSDRALREKPDAIQRFVNAWFAAVRVTTDDPQRAGQAVVQSGENEWTGIAKPEDLVDQLGLVAQATLAQNQFALADPNILAGRIREIQATWRAAGKQVANLDPLRLVESKFVLAAAGDQQLNSTKAPVNPSFVLTSRIQLPRLDQSQTGQTQAVAELPLKFIQFQPDSAVITEQSRQDIVEQIVPVLRKTPGLYLKVEGMAAQPPGVSEADVEATARDRTNAVISFLVGQGIDLNRLIGGTLKPEHPNSPSEEELRQDRKVVFTLVTPGGR